MARLFQYIVAMIPLFTGALLLGSVTVSGVRAEVANEEELSGPLLPQPTNPGDSSPADDGSTAENREKTPGEQESAAGDSSSPVPPEKSEKTPSVEGAVQEHASDAGNSANTAAGDKKETPAADEKSPPALENALSPPKPKRTLTPAMTQLRDQVRQTLTLHHKQPFGNRQNTACELMDFCLAYGCDTEVTLTERNGQHRVNGITCLCWNYPCAGYAPLMLSEGRIAARLGYGAQLRPSQMLAMLAFARVQASYPLRVGGAVRTVADLIESEKRDCRAGDDLSLKLIGLSYYVDEPNWENSLGQKWNLERIVGEVLDQEVPLDNAPGLERLLALGYAAGQREKRDLPAEGQFARARKYVEDFQEYAFPMQNPDGSWGYFLAGQGANRNEGAAFRSTAYVLEWLAATYPEEKLDDPRLVAAVKYLLQTLSSRQYRYNAAVLSTREINSYAHALHALTVYDDRYFHPADDVKPPAEPQPEKSAAESATAARSAANAK
ncbi:MAG: hypothetical protein JXB10_20205 [Pirellulales bacterium]|nr:hypothetical protein [Pirellulales bacterium]